MFKKLRQWLLGGDSDKREGAWLIFAIISGVLIYAVRHEAQGLEMEQTWDFLMIAWPAALAGVIGVHAQHHATMRGGK